MQHIVYAINFLLQWRSQPDIWSCSVYKPYKESISKEYNDNDLNLRSMTKLSGWLRSQRTPRY